MSARRRFFLAGGGGALVSSVLFAWLLTAGTWSLFEWHAVADLYDAQAEALLDGHLHMSRSVLGIEAFEHGGRTYMYQGPFPALLRLPVAAVSDGFDGRLAAVSMLVAFAVVAASVVALAWQVRGLVRGDAPVGRIEALAVAGFTFAATAGSAVLAIGSQVTVYYEGALWGLAMGLAASALVLRHVVAPRWWTLPVASASAIACLWSRASIGLGVTGALGLVFLGELLRWWRLRRTRTPWRAAEVLAPRRPSSWRAVVATLAAVAVPLALFAGLNVAKFGELSDVPWERQTFTRVSDDRAEFLDAHGGTFFGLDFIPSTLLAYLRPDGVRLDEDFPWIGFRTGDIGKRELAGGVLVDRVDATGTVPTSFPLLLVLGAVGGWALLRGRRELAPLWAPVLGAAAAAGSIFVFGYITLRYLADVVPVLVLLGAAGLAMAGEWSRRARPRRRVVAGVGLAVLVVAGVWVNLGQGLWYQRVYASPADESARQQFFELRQSLPSFGWGREQRVTVGTSLPASGRPGDVRVLGECDGLYVSDGATLDRLSLTNWKPVMRTPAVGAFELDMRFGRDGEGPLLVGGTGDEHTELVVVRVDDDHLRFTITGAGFGEGTIVKIDPDRWYRLRASLDPHTDFAVVQLGDRTVFSGGYGAVDVPRLAQDGWPDLRQRPVSRSLCQDVLADAGLGRD